MLSEMTCNVSSGDVKPCCICLSLCLVKKAANDDNADVTAGTVQPTDLGATVTLRRTRPDTDRNASRERERS